MANKNEAQKIPATAKLKEDRIVAEGETTGHFHQLQGGTVYDDGGTLLLDVPDNGPDAPPAGLTHQEHNFLPIKPGMKEIRIVNEFDPLQELVRKVVD